LICRYWGKYWGSDRIHGSTGLTWYLARCKAPRLPFVADWRTSGEASSTERLEYLWEGLE